MPPMAPPPPPPPQPKMQIPQAPMAPPIVQAPRPQMTQPVAPPPRPQVQDQIRNMQQAAQSKQVEIKNTASKLAKPDASNSPQAVSPKAPQMNKIEDVAAQGSIKVDKSKEGGTNVYTAGDDVQVIDVSQTNESGVSRNYFTDYNVSKKGAGN